jgi:hypothetical protein
MTWWGEGLKGCKGIIFVPDLQEYLSVGPEVEMTDSDCDCADVKFVPYTRNAG